MNLIQRHSNKHDCLETSTKPRDLEPFERNQRSYIYLSFIYDKGQRWWLLFLVQSDGIEITISFEQKAF